MVGKIVEWKNERWYVDGTDEDVKDSGTETSLFLLPERFADVDENYKLVKYGYPEKVGFWVYVSQVKEISQ